MPHRRSTFPTQYVIGTSRAYKLRTRSRCTLCCEIFIPIVAILSCSLTALSQLDAVGARTAQTSFISPTQLMSVHQPLAPICIDPQASSPPGTTAGESSALSISPPPHSVVSDCSWSCETPCTKLDGGTELGDQCRSALNPSTCLTGVSDVWTKQCASGAADGPISVPSLDTVLLTGETAIYVRARSRISRFAPSAAPFGFIALSFEGGAAYRDALCEGNPDTAACHRGESAGRESGAAAATHAPPPPSPSAHAHAPPSPMSGGRDRNLSAAAARSASARRRDNAPSVGGEGVGVGVGDVAALWDAARTVSHVWDEVAVSDGGWATVAAMVATVTPPDKWLHGLPTPHPDRAAVHHARTLSTGAGGAGGAGGASDSSGGSVRSSIHSRALVFGAFADAVAYAASNADAVFAVVEIHGLCFGEGGGSGGGGGGGGVGGGGRCGSAPSFNYTIRFTDGELSGIATGQLVRTERNSFTTQCNYIHSGFASLQHTLDTAFEVVVGARRGVGARTNSNQQRPQEASTPPLRVRVGRSAEDVAGLGGERRRSVAAAPEGVAPVPTPPSPLLRSPLPSDVSLGTLSASAQDPTPTATRLPLARSAPSERTSVTLTPRLSSPATLTTLTSPSPPPFPSPPPLPSLTPTPPFPSPLPSPSNGPPSPPPSTPADRRPIFAPLAVVTPMPILLPTTPPVYDRVLTVVKAYIGACLTFHIKHTASIYAKEVSSGMRRLSFAVGMQKSAFLLGHLTVTSAVSLLIGVLGGIVMWGVFLRSVGVWAPVLVVCAYTFVSAAATFALGSFAAAVGAPSAVVSALYFGSVTASASFGSSLQGMLGSTVMWSARWEDALRSLLHIQYHASHATDVDVGARYTHLLSQMAIVSALGVFYMLLGIFIDYVAPPKGEPKPPVVLTLVKVLSQLRAKLARGRGRGEGTGGVQLRARDGGEGGGYGSMVALSLTPTAPAFLGEMGGGVGGGGSAVREGGEGGGGGWEGGVSRGRGGGEGQMGSEDGRDGRGITSPSGCDVRVTHVTSTYTCGPPGLRKAVTSLRDVSMCARAGGETALVGPSGGGKSTLLSVLFGLTAPASGDVEVCGHDVRWEGVRVRDLVTWCPQENVMIGSLTVREHLEYFAVLQGVALRARVQAVEEVAAKVSLREVLDVRTKSLSAGTRRRVCVAAALLGTAKLTVLDAPTATLDARAREDVWRAIHEYATTCGTTLLFATSHLEEAVQHADEVVVLRGGEVVGVRSASVLASVLRRGCSVQVTLRSAPHAASERAGVPAGGGGSGGCGATSPLRALPGEGDYVSLAAIASPTESAAHSGVGGGVAAGGGAGGGGGGVADEACDGDGSWVSESLGSRREGVVRAVRSAAPSFEVAVSVGREVRMFLVDGADDVVRCGVAEAVRGCMDAVGVEAFSVSELSLVDADHLVEGGGVRPDVVVDGGVGRGGGGDGGRVGGGGGGRGGGGARGGEIVADGVGRCGEDGNVAGGAVGGDVPVTGDHGSVGDGVVELCAVAGGEDAREGREGVGGVSHRAVEVRRGVDAGESALPASARAVGADEQVSVNARSGVEVPLPRPAVAVRALTSTSLSPFRCTLLRFRALCVKRALTALRGKEAPLVVLLVPVLVVFVSMAVRAAVIHEASDLVVEDRVTFVPTAPAKVYVSGRPVQSLSSPSASACGSAPSAFADVHATPSAGPLSPTAVHDEERRGGGRVWGDVEVVDISAAASNTSAMSDYVYTTERTFAHPPSPRPPTPASFRGVPFGVVYEDTFVYLNVLDAILGPKSPAVIPAEAPLSIHDGKLARAIAFDVPYSILANASDPTATPVAFSFIANERLNATLCGVLSGAGITTSSHTLPIVAAATRGTMDVLLSDFVGQTIASIAVIMCCVVAARMSVRERVSLFKHAQRLAGAPATLFWATCACVDGVMMMAVVILTALTANVVLLFRDEPLLEGFGSSEGVMSYVMVGVVGGVACLPFPYLLSMLFNNVAYVTTATAAVFSFGITFAFLGLIVVDFIGTGASFPTAVFFWYPPTIYFIGLATALQRRVPLPLAGGGDVATHAPGAVGGVEMGERSLIHPPLSLVVPLLVAGGALWWGALIFAERQGKGARSSASTKAWPSERVGGDVRVYMRAVMKVYPSAKTRQLSGAGTVGAAAPHAPLSRPQRAFAGLVNGSLTVSSGEVAVVVGPNGSGKSTLLSILDGSLRPSSGCVCVGVQDLRTRVFSPTSVGWVGAESAVGADLTPNEHVELFAALRGVSMERGPGGGACNASDTDVLFSVLCLPTARRCARAGGLLDSEKRAVAVACALVGCPDVVLLDEPAAALGGLAARHFFDSLTTLVPRAAVVLTTNELRYIDSLPTTLLSLENGRVVRYECPSRFRGRVGDVYAILFRSADWAEACTAAGVVRRLWREAEVRTMYGQRWLCVLVPRAVVSLPRLHAVLSAITLKLSGVTYSITTPSLELSFFESCGEGTTNGRAVGGGVEALGGRGGGGGTVVAEVGAVGGGVVPRAGEGGGGVSNTACDYSDGEVVNAIVEALLVSGCFDGGNVSPSDGVSVDAGAPTASATPSQTGGGCAMGVGGTFPVTTPAAAAATARGGAGDGVYGVAITAPISHGGANVNAAESAASSAGAAARSAGACGAFDAAAGGGGGGGDAAAGVVTDSSECVRVAAAQVATGGPVESALPSSSSATRAREELDGGAVDGGEVGS